MRYVMVLLATLMILVPSVVSADELWIQNEGALEVTVEGTVTNVQYDGMSEFNPDNGIVVACDLETGWIVITGDIQSYDITLACGQDFEDVIPEVRLVVSNPAETDGVVDTEVDIPALAPSDSDDSGTSIVGMDTEQDTNENDNGPSIAEMNAEKAIEEYNEWFATVSWNELD